MGLKLKLSVESKSSVEAFFNHHFYVEAPATAYLLGSTEID